MNSVNVDIKEDPDPVLMCRVDERAKFLRRAQRRLDLIRFNVRVLHKALVDSGLVQKDQAAIMAPS